MTITTSAEKQAFTLIELLVVIAIIAVLAGLLFSVFGQAKAQAKSATCLSNLKNIGLAVGLYANSYDDYVPLCKDVADKITGQYKGTPYEAQVKEFALMSVVLRPYTGSAEVFRCPSDIGTHLTDFEIPRGFETTPSIFDKYGLSYTWNTEYSVFHYAFSAIKSPAENELSFDSSGSWHTGIALLNDESMQDLRNVRDFRYNMLFADFHVKNVSFQTMVDINIKSSDH